MKMKQIPIKPFGYCLTCDKEFGEVKLENQFDRFICPDDDNSSERSHITSVAIGPAGNYWSKIQVRILHYELYQSPINWFNSWRGLFKGRIGFYLLCRFIIILSALVFSYPFTKDLKTILLNIFFSLVSLIIIFDIVAVTTSAAFISRFFSIPLRSILLTLFSFFQLVIAFAVFYRQFASQFEDIVISSCCGKQ